LGIPRIHAGKIAVLGESMGGEQALVAIGADPRIQAVVAEGATGQQLAGYGWLPHGIDGALQRGMEWVMYTTAGLLSGAPRPASIPDSIHAAAPRRVLIIAGGAVADGPIAARWFQAASPATVHVWVVPHAGHTQGLATAPQAWETHVISFLNAVLHPVTTTAGRAPGATANRAAAVCAAVGEDDLRRNLSGLSLLRAHPDARRRCRWGAKETSVVHDLPWQLGGEQVLGGPARYGLGCGVQLPGRSEPGRTLLY
jgi:hypothetical protein